MRVVVTVCADVRAFDAVLAASGPIEHRCPQCGSVEHGRPLLTGQPELGISIARSGRWSALAVNPDGPVGLDLEIERDVSEIEAVALHPDERQALVGMSADDRAAAVLRTWVVKESILKLTGDGLARAPESFALPRDAAVPLIAPAIADGRPVWTAVPGVRPGLVLAVSAFAPPVPEIRWCAADTP